MRHPLLTKDWHDASNNLVVLAAPDEATLDGMMDSAHARGIEFVPFFEPDFDNALTAVAFAPGEKTRRFLANLPLALREVALV